MKSSHRLSLVTGALLMVLSSPQASAQSAEPAVAETAIDGRIKVGSDRRLGAVSETFNGPGVELHVEAAHASGLVAVAELASVSKVLYPGGRGWATLLGAGYRWGDHDGWHFGLGISRENFLGYSVKDVPTGFSIDSSTGDLTPTGTTNVNANTSYAVVEFGHGAIEARYLNVLSRDFRGVNSASICGTLLSAAVAAGDVDAMASSLACYGNGLTHSRGTQLLDIDWRRPLDGRTSLTTHIGFKWVNRFSQANVVDWKLGVEHQRWGVTWIAEAMGAKPRTEALYKAADTNGTVKKLYRPALVLSAAYSF